MNNVQKINYGPLGAELRIIIDDEQKIWFVAKDIGEMLELKNIRYNLAELPKGVSTTYPLATDGGVQNLTVVSEGGLYRLVFKSRKPEAEAFVTWVTEEVLPQIRKTGSYSVKKESVTPSATAGQDIINGWRYTAEIQKYLDRCYREI